MHVLCRIMVPFCVVWLGAHIHSTHLLQSSFEELRFLCPIFWKWLSVWKEKLIQGAKNNDIQLIETETNSCIQLHSLTLSPSLSTQSPFFPDSFLRPTEELNSSQYKPCHQRPLKSYLCLFSLFHYILGGTFIRDRKEFRIRMYPQNR